MQVRRLSASLFSLLLALLLTGSPALGAEPTADEKVFLSASEFFRTGKPGEAPCLGAPTGTGSAPHLSALVGRWSAARSEGQRRIASIAARARRAEAGESQAEA